MKRIAADRLAPAGPDSGPQGALDFAAPAPPARRRRTRAAAPPAAPAEPTAEQAAEDATIRAALAIITARLGVPGAAMKGPTDVRNFLCLHLGALKHEVFAILYLDAQHRLIHYDPMFRGTLSQTSVYPREILRAALLHNAAAIIVAHNHPSGKCDPSRADEVLTRAITEALKHVDVKLLDHIIVAGAESISMAEKGLV